MPWHSAEFDRRGDWCLARLDRVTVGAGTAVRGYGGVWPLVVAARSSSSSLDNPCPPQTTRDPGIVITTACIVILDDLPETLDEFLLT